MRFVSLFSAPVAQWLGERIMDWQPSGLWWHHGDGREVAA